MSVTNRVLYSNNGVITDLTRDVNKYQSGTGTIASWVAAEDYLYLGAMAPFNHFYLKMATASVTPATMSAQYWDGRQWRDVYRLDDDTAGMTTSGYVTIFPNKDYGWLSDPTKDKNDEITGLTGTNIYDLFWLRLKLSVDVPAGMSIAWAGQKFSDDEDLASEFPDLVRAKMLLAYGATKTSWEEQHVKAAELIAQDLISSEVINWKGQLLVREEFILASVQKVAELIFNALGDDYTDQRDRAAVEYKRRLDKSAYRIDANSNALLSPTEAVTRTGFMAR